jgi:hypothetical protein
MAKKLEYSFVDFDDYEVGRGGPTPEWTCVINGDTLEVTVDEDAYDAEPPESHADALEVLQDRLRELEKEATELRSFLSAATATTRYIGEGDNQEDQ